VAERAGTGGLTWMLGDHHGTNGLSITAGALKPTERYTDPFGNTRGTQPTWPDKHGFVGGYQDTTGLTRLGARDYDPATGRFTQADAQLDTGTPQFWNGYAYANNAPATLSDPSGLSVCSPGHPEEYGPWCAPGWKPDSGGTPSPGAAQAGADAKNKALANNNYDANAVRNANETVHKSKWDVFIDVAGEVVKSLIGWDDISNCVTNGDFGACAMAIVTVIPWGKIFKIGEIVADFWRGAKALINFGRDVEKAEKVIVDSERVLADAERAGQEAQRAVAESERAAAGEAKAAESAKASGTAESSAGRGAEHDPILCETHSFVPGTQVLMADGSTKSIQDVQVGDVVETTDPETGQTAPHKVVGTIVHGDEDTLTELTVDGGGSVDATDWHPVWVDELGQFVAIGDLKPGEHLRSADGSTHLVTGVRHHIAQQLVYDLTVDGVHTYYVVAGDTSVLVHNCPGAGGGGGAGKAKSPGGNPDRAKATEATSKKTGDRRFATQEEARSAALDSHGVSDHSMVEAHPKYGKNPNLNGPNNEPWEELHAINDEGDLVVIDHHASGHWFKDNNTFSLPHYHGPSGEHFFYGTTRVW
jgi:RHS repeat-associated protein